MSTFLSNKALRWALGAFLVARIALTVWSLLIVQLLPVQVENLDLFGAPVLATFDLKTGERHAYSRQVGGAILSFHPGEPGHVVDAQTSSVWSLRDGRALSGAYVGRTLSASAYSAEDIFPYRGVTAETNPLLAPWQRFDANWYVAIAERGYGTIPGDVHFPPLYPALIHLFGVFIGNYFVAGLLISNLATIAMLAVFYQVVSEYFDASVAARATVFLLIFPTAFFFFSAYTESLFLLVALLALWSMQKQNWLWAGFWSFCAILIRLQGIALFAPLLYALWAVRPIDKKFARFVSLVLPIGAVALYLFIRAVAGDSAIIPTSEPSLFARLVPPWENYIYALQTLASAHFTIADVLNWLVTTIFVVLLVIGWRKLPVEYSLYAVASIVVLTMRLVDTQPLNSMARYALTLFPVFILMGMWGKDAWTQRAIVYPSFPLALFLSAQFVMWGWVG
jgi:Gpi18-like mannosyltransferase